MLSKARHIAPLSGGRHNDNGSNRQRGGAGLPVDFQGGPTVDPTENVKDLMEASIKAMSKEMDLLARLQDEKIKRLEQTAIYQKEEMVLRAEHYKEIRHMESDRVDKIRSVDVANAAATAAQLLSAVTTLATTAQATAETLRNQVAATAAAVASQTERVVNPIIERLALLEKSSNFGQGRAELANPAMSELIIEMRKSREGYFERQGQQAVTDPAIAAAITTLTADVKILAANQQTNTGKTAGVNNTWVAIAAVAGVILTIGGLVIATLTFGAMLYLGRTQGGIQVTPPATISK